MVGTILNIALPAAFILALIIGLVKGWVRQLSDSINGLIAVVGAVILTALIMKYLPTLQFYQSFVDVTSSWFKSEMLQTEVSSLEELEALLSGGALSLLGALAGILYPSMETLGCTTLARLFGNYVANLIVETVLWILLFLALKYILKGIKALLLKITDLPVLRTIDRIIGGFWAVCMAYVILVGLVLTGIEVIILKFTPGAWESFAAFIQTSKALSLLHDTNLIGSWLANMAQIQIPMVSVIQ